MSSTRLYLAGFAVAFCVCSAWSNSYANLLAYEDFDYAPVGGDLTGHGGGGSLGFSNAWSGQTSYNVGNGSLLHPTSPLVPIGNSVTAVAFGDNRGIDRDLTTPLGVEGTSAYVSVLLRPEGILHQGAYGGWFGLALRGSTDIVIGMNYNTGVYGFDLGFERSSSTVPAVIGKAAFCVLRIDFTEGVDSTYLYVNPLPGAPEPPSPSGELINLNVNSLARVSLTGPGASSYDAIRIGTTWADVVPASADFDGDGSVGSGDFDSLDAGFGLPGNHGDGDSNFDGVVDGADALLLQRQVGFLAPANGLAAVPEPASLALMILATLAVALWRRP